MNHPRLRLIFAILVASSAIAAIPDSYGAQHSGILSLGAGPASNGACAVLADHHVTCWGAFYTVGPVDTRPKDIVGITTATSVAEGDSFGCALLSNGNVWCWGAGAAGQLGDGTFTARVEAKPVTVASSPLGQLSAISLGKEHACAIRFDNVYCWGANYDGEVGNFNAPLGPWNSPIIVVLHDMVTNPPLSGINWISSGAYHTCAMKADGTARCWGWDRDGQLGDGSASEAVRSPNRVVIGTDALTMIPQSLSAGGNAHTCALINDVRPYHVACWGENSFGELGNLTSPFEDSNHVIYNPVPSTTTFSDGTFLVDVQSVTTGGNMSCGLLTDGTIACWGRNDLGQLADPPLLGANSSSPVAVYAANGSLLGSSVPIKQVAAGFHHVCALSETSDVFCWGDNSAGQLGGAVTGSKTDTPTLVSIDAPIFTDNFEGD